ncbi:MAG: DUF6573 family protein [Nitrospiraceae bacterium]
MDKTQSPRGLSHDERKAADAAFSGRPFNPGWSESAKKVYEGLIHALPPLPDDSTPTPNQTVQHEAEPVEAAPALPTTPESKLDLPGKLEGAPAVQIDTPTNQLVTNRQQAIQAGFLIDVTTDAQKLGLSFPVTITKPLWEIGIASSQTLSEADKSERLRDILMAFRLRLASQATLSPLVDFPAMLALPPGAVPQPVPLFALIQPDEQNRAVVTLLLPNEVSATIIPMN